MSDHNPNSGSDQDWDDAGELAWNEIDWEHYLRVQDEVIQRYLTVYDQQFDHQERIDETARLMGWDRGDWSTDPADDPAGPYTLHQNPVFIATRALFTGVRRDWEKLPASPAGFTAAVQALLGRAETQALLAIQALDLGDYGLAVSLFKRALRELNDTFSLVNHPGEADGAAALSPSVLLVRLFDLREIWLRVMNECRDELACPFEDDGDDEE
jgi:hypothetical protein